MVTAPPRPSPTGPPLLAPRSLGGWMRENLFRNWWNSLVTLVFAALFLWGLVWVIRWAFIDADWEIVQRNLTLFMVGRFPRDELWRLWTAGGLLAVMVGVATGSAAARSREKAAEAGLPHQATHLRDVLRRYWPLLGLLVVLLVLARTLTPAYLTAVTLAFGWVSFLTARRAPRGLRRFSGPLVLLLLVAAYVAMAGFGGVGWENWSGLHLNVFLTVAGILFAFPLGLVFALGRRSNLPVMRLLSVLYIEFIRGVPLISLLLMGDLALGFFFPPDLVPGRVTRVLIMITLFEGAYIAEIVRGGLQGVPRGQREAAQALGLSPLQVTRLVVLPQALRSVIPAMVGQFISLYKDTSLVAILGMLDLLAVAGVAAAQPDFLAQGLEIYTYPFVALIFWVGSYTMSREAGRMERKLGVGER